MKLQPLSPMIGFQCSPAVQPVYGRGGPLFAPAPPSAGFHRPPLLPPHILDYFPGLAGDGLRISWAHAVNSRSRLNAALMGKPGRSPVHSHPSPVPLTLFRLFSRRTILLLVKQTSCVNNSYASMTTIVLMLYITASLPNNW